MLTKADKLSPTEVEAKTKELEEYVTQHPMCYPEIVVTSSLHSVGLDRLKTLIVAACVKDFIKDSHEPPRPQKE